MGLVNLAIEAQHAWFELLARSSVGPTWELGSGMAVVTGIPSNSDNGIVLDRAALNNETSVQHLIRPVLDTSLPATLVLTETVPAKELAPLEALGLQPENSANQMAMSLSTAPDYIEPAGIVIDEVSNTRQLRGGLGVLGQNWFDETELEQRLNCFAQIGIGPSSPVRHWLASRDGEVVAMATSFRFRDIVELAHCGVLAPERRKGIATALTAVRLTSAFEDGASQAVLSPSPDGYELHRTLGFQTTRVSKSRLFYLPTQEL